MRSPRYVAPPARRHGARDAALSLLSRVVCLFPLSSPGPLALVHVSPPLQKYVSHLETVIDILGTLGLHLNKFGEMLSFSPFSLAFKDFGVLCEVRNGHAMYFSSLRIPWWG